jgi:2,4-dienoyl-CoA reductase-like NADH-dependent reductase (Old Yellow Enzyme family)
MKQDPIFKPLVMRNLTVKNRIFRSNISGRWDNHDGSGTNARINWELKFARGGVGAIISSFVPVHISGRILPNYAMLDSDERIPFWRALIQAVHEHDTRYLIQLSHGGRQRDVPGIENAMSVGLSSTDTKDSFHGLLCRAASIDEIGKIIEWFARAAVRAREAGADGVELHASHGYLFTQFLSSAINDRKDKYGGSLENRARFLLEVIEAIRREVGRDYHLQVKINAVDLNNALYPWERPGNTLEESIQVCKWVEAASADALHVSIGSIFPHPLLPSGGFPLDVTSGSYGVMIASGTRAYLNHQLFRYRLLRPLFRKLWNRAKKDWDVEGVSRELAREVKRNVTIPVINTGGYQDASLVRKLLEDGWIDAVSIARPLVANNDLPQIWAAGRDLPERPCSFCNRCLVHAIADPLGCYDLDRFDGDYDAMVREIHSVYHPARAWQQLDRPLAAPAGEPSGCGTGADTQRNEVGVEPGKVRTVFRSVQLEDVIRTTPVDRAQQRFRRRVAATLAAVIALGLIWVLVF